MGKISRYSNLYDKDGNLIREAPLRAYSIEELEQLADKLANEKDENGHIKDPAGFNNVMAQLFKLYETKGNPHKNDLIGKLNEYAKSRKKVSDAEVIAALNDVNKTLDDNTETGEHTENEVPDTATADTENSVEPELGDNDTVQRGNSDIQEERVYTQDDLLVERDEVEPVMEEYVDFEEITEPDGE